MFKQTYISNTMILKIISIICRKIIAITAKPVENYKHKNKICRKLYSEA
jgi:hypothetical protein